MIIYLYVYKKVGRRNVIVFFFSSRRRHTRWNCDWSSDVCSSDLRVHKIVTGFGSDEGYSLILDAADGNIIFGDRTLDLTDRVLAELKKEDSNGLPQPASA